MGGTNRLGVLPNPEPAVAFNLLWQQRPHVFGSVFNEGVGKPFGYLLDSPDTFIVQVDIQGLLQLARRGTSGDAAHQPVTNPATAGMLTAINIP
jgi:hypothetical protein